MKVLGMVGLVLLGALAAAMGVLMIFNGEVARGLAVGVSACGPIYLSSRLRQGKSLVR
jgi:hypothetical protein